VPEAKWLDKVRRKYGFEARYEVAFLNDLRRGRNYTEVEAQSAMR
jgi:hypothetical protein